MSPMKLLPLVVLKCGHYGSTVDRWIRGLGHFPDEEHEGGYSSKHCRWRKGSGSPARRGKLVCYAAKYQPSSYWRCWRTLLATKTLNGSGTGRGDKWDVPGHVACTPPATRKGEWRMGDGEWGMGNGSSKRESKAQPGGKREAKYGGGKVGAWGREAR